MGEDAKALEEKAQSERRLGLLILENKDGAALAGGVPHLRTAADIWGQLNWPERRAEVLLDLARLHVKAGNHAEAAAAGAEALSLFANASDGRAIDAASAAGTSYLEIREVDRGLEVLKRGLQIAEEKNDHLRIAQSALELARAWNAKGRPDEAIQACERAHRLFTDFRKGIQRAQCHECLAEAHAIGGDAEASAREYETCVGIYQNELGRPQEAAEVLGRWADRARDRGDFPTAIAILERCLQGLMQTGNRAAEARVHRRIGRVHAERGADPEAAAAFQRSLEICQATGDQDGVSRSLYLLGAAAIRAGRSEDGLLHLRRSSDIARQIANLHQLEQATAAIAKELRARGRHEEALATMHTWVEVLKQLGDRQDTIKVLGEIAEVHQQRGALADAEIHLRRLVEVCCKPEDSQERARARYHLGTLLARKGEHQESYLHLAKALEDFGSGIELSRFARINYQMGMSSLYRHDPATALEHFEKALQTYDRAPDDQAKAKVLVGIGNAKAMLGADQEAKNVFDEAAELCERQGDVRATQIIKRATLKL